MLPMTIVERSLNQISSSDAAPAEKKRLAFNMARFAIWLVANAQGLDRLAKITAQRLIATTLSNTRSHHENHRTESTIGCSAR